MPTQKPPVPAQDVRARKFSKPLFTTGTWVATPMALACLEKHAILPLALFSRHAHGDWGDVGAEDAQSNEDAIESGARILSVYLVEGTKLYLVTEAASDDGTRAVSTLLAASEY